MMMKGFGLDESIMSNLTSTLSGETSISSTTTTTTNQPHLPPPPKKKRSLPGNPDPDAEVIALSPKSLLATNRFICEICNKGFQRDQNLQLHRRGHNLPWKLKQRASKDEIRKKVYVCPEPTCVHHERSRALGDLTGIKKHFCRKHGEKKWKCDKCSKKYAVQSDWKAHSKICGTREYRCDCGTLFSRRDSFITHRAFCDALAAAEESGRYNSSPNLPSSSSSHLLHSLSSQPIHVSFPPWLSSSPQPPHLFATVDESLPPMSATALLQKAAEMGVTLMSNQHVSTTTASSAAIAMCSSSREHDDIMIINSLQSTSSAEYGNHHQGVVVQPSAPLTTPFHDDGLSTRDFLGLRSFSHKDLMNMAGHLGAQINSSAANPFDHHQQQEQHLHHDHDHDYDHHQNQTPW